MQKIWHESYESGVPSEIVSSAYDSIPDIFTEACAKFADKTAYHNCGSELSYLDVERHSRNFAAFLQSGLGLKKGNRVAVMSPNLLSFPVALFGIVRAGLVQVNVNPLYTARELKHQLNDADVETIVIFSGATNTLADIIEESPVKTVIIIGMNDLVEKNMKSPPIDDRLATYTCFMDALSHGEGMEFEAPALSRDDLLFLQYTGGTTGVSKGAMLTHGNLVSNILMYETMMKSVIAEGDEIIITAIPLYHIFALMMNCLAYFKFGATNVLITNPRDMDGFVSELSKWKFTAFTGVNTLYNGLLHTDGFADCDFSGLKIAVGGGASVQEIVSNKWQSATGIHITEGYGLSETSPVLTMSPANLGRFSNSIGLPVPSTDITLRDEDGDDVELGQPGELCAKGPQVTPGYWRREEATAEAMTEDGYFKTGDIAVMDDRGFLKIVDRKKDMILVSGFNVFPNEIEAIVAEIPGIVECACIGVDDETSGEAVKVFAVKNDSAVDETMIASHCKEHLAGYKVPKFIEFMDELPKSTVGKILRRELRT